MDLRQFNPSREQLDIARKLMIRGLITYQPWLFSDVLESGVGLEFELNEPVGLIYYPDIDRSLLASPEMRRIVVDPGRLAAFRAANSRLRRFYDAVIERLVEAVGGTGGTTTLDVGCNTGYFPLAFARRGALRAVGCDRQDFTEAFALLNKLLGTNAEFIATRYDPALREITRIQPADIVTSLAVLCHVGDPLQFLACLGKLTKKALFIWTIVNEDSGLSMRYGEPRGDYPGDEFPFCFDNAVCPSISLLRRSFELMGFRQVIDFPATGDDLPRFSARSLPFHGVLGLR